MLNLINMPFEPISVKDKHLINAGNMIITEKAITLLYGKNGKGKTLLLSYLREQLGGTCTLVSQNNDMFLSNLSVEENLSLTIDDQAIVERYKKMLSHFDALHLLERKMKHLSGGEKRILLLTRGFASEAEFIIIDEPTNDLDFTKVEKLKELLKELSIEKTFLIVSHDDRLKEIGIRTYLIKDHKLLDATKHMNQMMNMVEDKVYFPNKRRKNHHIKKAFSLNFLLFAMIPLFGLFLNFMLNDLSSFLHDEIPSMPLNQVEIFSPLTNFQDNLSSALPISFFDLIIDMERLPTRSVVEEFVHDFMQRTLTLTLDELLLEEGLGQFSVEFWVPDRRILVTPISTYLNELLEKPDHRYYIDTSDYFDSSWLFVHGYRPIAMNADDYHEAVRLTRDIYNNPIDPMKTTYLVLTFNEAISIFDFLTRPEIAPIRQGNYFIRSHEIVQMINQIMILQSLTDFRNTSIGFAVLILLINLIYTLLYLTINIKKIKIFRDYGFEKKEIKKAIIKKYCHPYMLTGTIAIMTLINTFLLRANAMEAIFIAHFPTLFTHTALILSTTISSVLIKMKVNNVFKWQRR
ncbi:MAG: ATP-binding cassette domain-containing protein [Defluviitaleaceae bacterium]|nr:ATP-binding cassette domain-containing protein [Defluviitaleaceae bacterium]